MVQLSLPQNSKVKPGKTWPGSSGAKRPKTIKVYRWSPEDGENPRLDTYEVDLDACGPMVLDVMRTKFTCGSTFDSTSAEMRDRSPDWMDLSACCACARRSNT